MTLGERTAVVTGSIAALTFIGGIATRLFLVCGDALFKLFWKRNTDFTQARAAEQFGAQLEQLAELPGAIKEQTRVMRAVLETQRQHGEGIAALSAAVNLGLGADLDSPLRRHRKRRHTDPAPTDGPPDQHESVGEEHEDDDDRR